MPRLTLDDRTYEDSDGIWTTIELKYSHPWENGAEPDIAVWIRTFSKKEGRFDFDNPDCTKFFHLDEMATIMLAGFFDAAGKLMPRQWAEYLVQEAERKSSKER